MPHYYSYGSRTYIKNEYKLLYSPNTPVLDLDDVKNYIKVDDTADDDLISLIIQNVTSYAENFTKRDFLLRQYKTFLECFTDFELRKSLLQKIESIKYKDSDEVLQTLSSDNYYFTQADDFSYIIFEDVSITDISSRLQRIEIIVDTGFGLVIDTIARATNVVTVTTEENHNFTSGDIITIAGVTETGFNGNFDITVTGAKTFTYADTDANDTGSGTLMSANKIPEDLRIAMLQHIAKVYSNRGDCAAGNQSACSCSSKMNLPGETVQTYNMYRIEDFKI